MSREEAIAAAARAWLAADEDEATEEAHAHAA